MMTFLRFAFKTLLVFVSLSFLPSMVLADGVVGKWEFRANDVPPEYTKGEILITKAEDNYVVTLLIHGHEINARDVVVDKDTVSFSVYVEETSVKVKLKMDGDSFKGSASTYEGPVTIEGKRSKN